MLLVSVNVYASINFEVEPNTVYNLGDKSEITIRIVPEPSFNEVVSVYLVCKSNKVEVYKEFFSLAEETSKAITVPLVRSFIGNLSGECNFEVQAGSSVQAISNGFEISKLIRIEFLNWGDLFNPGGNVTISGSAIKENGVNVRGFYEMSIENNNGSITFSGEVINGLMNVFFEIPSNFYAGEHKIDLNVFDKGPNGEVLNSGRKVSFLTVRQVPTSIEIILDKESILPGESIRGKIILHDQTGESIMDEEAYIAIKYKDGEIINKVLSKTEETFSYETGTSTPPAILQISAYAGDVINSLEVEILVNKKIESEIVNSTLILTNIGNVFYEDVLVVEVGEDNVSIPLSLGVGESERYSISAPEGDYDVSVLGSKNRLSLSGRAVQVQKIGEGFSFSSMIWLVALVILVLGAYLILKRNYKRKTYARRKTVRREVKVKEVSDVNDISDIRDNEVSKEDWISRGVNSREKIFAPQKKAELSLSITGSKQSATMGCLFLRNYEEIKSGDGGIKETLDRIFRFVEDSKGVIYENKSYIFFILAPSVTKTFKNQKEGVIISQKIKEILVDHNRKFKQKIDYGISLNYGEIITKPERDKIKFMSLGTFMTSGKKLSSFSKGEILISEQMKANLEGDVKTEFVPAGGLKSYKLEGIIDRNNHSTFIKGFLARQERDKAKEKELVNKE
ncbi:MAG: hypothetical protein Q8Q04_00720 [archaeon]|nr:hypothetical protein [archaeon]